MASATKDECCACRVVVMAEHLKEREIESVKVHVQFPRGRVAKESVIRDRRASQPFNAQRRHGAVRSAISGPAHIGR